MSVVILFDDFDQQAYYIKRSQQMTVYRDIHRPVPLENEPNTSNYDFIYYYPHDL